MFDYLRGIPYPKDSDYLALDVNGVGYKIMASAPVIASFMNKDTTPKEATLYVECIIREDAHTLYGFLNEFDRELFRLLMSATGVGPKLALQIMNHGTPQEIIRALSMRDTLWFSSISGIGKKTAERISVELSDKATLLSRSAPSLQEILPLNSESGKNNTPHVKSPPIGSTPVREDAIQALIALGLSDTEARQSIRQALQHLESSEEESVLKLIQLSLLHRKKNSSSKVSTK